MVQVLLVYIILFTLLFFSFVYTFYRVFYMSGYCPVGFHSFTSSHYSTFKVMLNLLDITTLTNENSEGPIAVLHVTFTFTVSIMLINFLIGLMSNAVGNILEHGSATLAIQKLSTMMVLERRTYFLLKPFSRWIQKYFFIHKDNRLYLLCYVPAVNSKTELNTSVGKMSIT